MNIGTIGTGRMASALAALWAAIGHGLVLGSRDPAGARARLTLHDPGIRIGTVPEAVAFGDVVLVATPWSAGRDAIRAGGSFEGKILIDCMNPIVRDAAGLHTGMGSDTSAAEQVARWAIGARVFKAFNSIYWETLGNPRFGTQIATCFYCGEDGEAKESVARLVRETGFEAVDAGPLSSARFLEPLALLWIQLASERGMVNDIAIKLIRR